MKFLLTTSKGICVLDGQHLSIVYPTADKKVYGLTWDGKHVYAARQEPTHSTIMVFNRGMKLIREIPVHEISDAHQLYWTDGLLYVANSRYNRIHIWDGKEFVWRAWNVVGRDVNHINSIWSDDSGDLYFVEHNRFTQPIRRSRIRIMGKGFKQRSHFQTGRGVHNIYRQANNLIFCSSNDFTFVKYDMKLREVIQEVDMPDQKIFGYEWWLTRGLAHDGKDFYVGLSEWAPRERRSQTVKGAIAIVNSAFRYEDFIPLEGMGQVYEIRLMDRKDLAHNRVAF